MTSWSRPVAAGPKFGGLPFDQQIAFFRRKLNLPTESWTDIFNGQHSRAFVIAGATRDELLADFRAAVDKVIAQGVTLEQFRKDFDQIVAKHGWAYNGSRNWRSRVIYDTNLRTSYMAGRWQQAQAIKRRRPYWRYRHNDAAVIHPRPLHKAWSGTVLSADDPWWSTHFPPNGWGCKCYFDTLSEGDLTALGKSGPDPAPAVEWRTVTVGKNGPNPRTVEVPAGIDPGFGYNVGEAAWGRNVAQRVLDEQAGGKWVEIPGKTPAELGRPAKVPLDETAIDLGGRAESPADLEPLFEKAIGGEQAYVADPLGEQILLDRTIPDHIAESPARLDGRETFFPLLRETVTDPYEIWISWARNELTGRYAIRRRYIKGFQLSKGKAVTIVTESVGNVWIGVTAYRSDPKAGAARVGTLIYARDAASAERGP
jgi:hypothetical protein